MIISPFTPLFFPEIKVDGIDSRYIQTFATSDEILVEVIGLASEGTPTASIICEPSQDVLCNIQFSQWDINANDRLFFATLNLSPGLYSVQIGDKRSTIFRITDNEAVLEKTTLIQYSMANNRQRKDAVFFIDGMQRFFDFRVPGGFKDSNWSFICFLFWVEFCNVYVAHSRFFQLSSLHLISSLMNFYMFPYRQDYILPFAIMC